MLDKNGVQRILDPMCQNNTVSLRSTFKSSGIIFLSAKLAFRKLEIQFQIIEHDMGISTHSLPFHVTIGIMKKNDKVVIFHFEDERPDS